MALRRPPASPLPLGRSPRRWAIKQLLRWTAGLVLAGQLSGLPALAAEIRVVSSGGFAPAYERLAPEFERTSGHTLVTAWGPSMGETENAIPQRLKRGEAMDVVIMVGAALDKLVAAGQVLPDSATLLAHSPIALAVRAGAPKPDISTPEALRTALLQARSIAYSDSASGVYLEKVLFPRLGIAEALAGKARMIPAEPVGKVVARGEAELGFQQLSELKAISGIDIVGLIPPETQSITKFSAGVLSTAREPDAARVLIRFLAAPEAAPVIRETGLEPAEPLSPTAARAP